MCTRAVYVGQDDIVITLRSMDWFSDLGSNLWVFPRGMERDGAVTPGGLVWTSKYGSVVTSAFDVATTDGMNEAGLVANLLYLSESDYGDPVALSGTKPAVNVAAWAQYVLDNYATVAEAVEDLAREPFYMVPVHTPDGMAGTVHLAITDPTGDIAIIEYIGGKPSIHHGAQYRVMTNSPVYDEQLALNRYWDQIGGMTMLPGTNRAADRFVRASFYLKILPEVSDMREAVATAFSVIRNVSVPIGINTPDQPNIGTTLWRTVSDHKNKRYYFESARSPNVFWVDLADLDFSPGAPVMQLTLTGGDIFAGNVSPNFQPSEPFAFMSAEL